ncbi:hypothetical protein PMAYCL1PPCAC_07870, partial [Pristionchus mayeri]
QISANTPVVALTQAQNGSSTSRSNHSIKEEPIDYSFRISGGTNGANTEQTFISMAAMDNCNLETDGESDIEMIEEG